jgi:hypothetical protein
MEAVRTSEKSVNFNVPTWCYVPEDSKLHTRHHENLKCHKMITVWLHDNNLREVINSYLMNHSILSVPKYRQHTVDSSENLLIYYV